MTSAETITIFLMDGDANGRIKASIENWTGVGYKIPRDKLDECSSIAFLSQSSVYFLFGSSKGEKSPVYIGQAVNRKNGKGILARLKEHAANPEKDYWTDAIVFTTKDNSFGPTELSYLENYFCNLAIFANRYEVKNANDPNSGNITEEKESSLNRYASYAQLILGVFGYKVFTPLSKQEKKEPPKMVIPKKPVLSNSKTWMLDASVLLSGGKPSSVYMKQYLLNKKYITNKMNFTIAKINKDGSGRFWANPPVEFLNGDWVLALNDVLNRRISLFRIPANAISCNEVKTRKVKTKAGKESIQIDLEIVQKTDSFKCVASGIEYSKWFVETIAY